MDEGVDGIDVLVVDDDDQIRDVLGAILQEEGYAVAVAADGQEALEWLGLGTAPRVILLDLMMPGMNGWEFLAHRERDPLLVAIPLVVLSGVAGLQQVGLPVVEERLEKPIHLGLLLETVARYCGRR